MAYYENLWHKIEQKYSYSVWNEGWLSAVCTCANICLNIKYLFVLILKNIHECCFIMNIIALCVDHIMQSSKHDVILTMLQENMAIVYCPLLIYYRINYNRHPWMLNVKLCSVVLQFCLVYNRTLSKSILSTKSTANPNNRPTQCDHRNIYLFLILTPPESWELFVIPSHQKENSSWTNQTPDKHHHIYGQSDQLVLWSQITHTRSAKFQNIALKELDAAVYGNNVLIKSLFTT